MKTTIDIADNLLARAKEVAYQQKTTLRTLVEEGLDEIIKRRKKTTRVRIRPVVVRGGGFTQEFQNATWEQIRDEIYRGRGT